MQDREQLIQEIQRDTVEQNNERVSRNLYQYAMIENDPQVFKKIFDDVFNTFPVQETRWIIGESLKEKHSNFLLFVEQFFKTLPHFLSDKKIQDFSEQLQRIGKVAAREYSTGEVSSCVMQNFDAIASRLDDWSVAFFCKELVDTKDTFSTDYKDFLVDRLIDASKELMRHDKLINLGHICLSYSRNGGPVQNKARHELLEMLSRSSCSGDVLKIICATTHRFSYKRAGSHFLMPVYASILTPDTEIDQVAAEQLAHFVKDMSPDQKYRLGTEVNMLPKDYPIMYDAPKLNRGETFKVICNAVLDAAATYIQSATYPEKFEKLMLEMITENYGDQKRVQEVAEKYYAQQNNEKMLGKLKKHYSNGM